MTNTARTRTPLTLPRPLVLMLRPFQKFFKTESASGVLLLGATAVALVWANSDYSQSYHRLLEQVISFQGFGIGLAWPLHHWINDALMAVFFFLVGMEIKRELVLGELDSVRRAMLPAIAALGGMLVPALFFVVFNRGTPGMPGWGIPVATDIAFALGCLALLRNRVPASLAVFLTALAIFDDLGAILVIALFYGHSVDVAALLAAGGLLLVLLAMNLFGVRRLVAYVAVGVLLWVAVLQSGIHATLAGVLLGLVIPARTGRDPAELGDLPQRLDELAKIGSEDDRTREETLGAVEGYLYEAQSPLDRAVHALHPWVAFFVIPVFALANAGVDLRGLSFAELFSPVSLGIALGLFVGKQLGIFAATFAAVRLRLSPMPSRSNWRQIYGVAMLGGIGFTMSLFIAALAFPGAAELNAQAKIGILLGSLASAVGGLLFLRFAGGASEASPAELAGKTELPAKASQAG